MPLGPGPGDLPTKIVAMGGKFLWDDDKETPEVLSSSYLFPEQKKMIEFEVRPWATNTEGGAGVGNIFYGSEGLPGHQGLRHLRDLPRPEERARSAANRPGASTSPTSSTPSAAARRRTSTDPVETGHLRSALAHLGNIAYRLGRRLEFDPPTERFVGDSEANAMLTRKYRKPYRRAGKGLSGAAAARL